MIKDCLLPQRKYFREQIIRIPSELVIKILRSTLTKRWTAGYLLTGRSALGMDRMLNCIDIRLHRIGSAQLDDATVCSIPIGRDGEIEAITGNSVVGR